jgi:hypothetical protein
MYMIEKMEKDVLYSKFGGPHNSFPSIETHIFRALVSTSIPLSGPALPVT